MVRSEIKLALSDPFVWYESYRYFGTDLERFHCHPVWQLTVVTEGCLRFDFGPRGVFPLNAGDIMLIAPETPHEGHSIAEKTHSMQLFCRYFDSNMLPEISELFSPFQVNAVWFGHRSPEVFQELSAKILADCPSTQPFGCSWRFPLLSTFLLLGLESLRGIQETTHPPLSPELSRIFPFMLEHYQEAIGVNELADVEGITIQVIGGVLRKRILTCVGPMAEETLGQLVVDKVFISVNCISPEYGLTASNITEGSLVRCMLKAGLRRYLLMNSQKFGGNSIYRICSVDDVHVIVTDDGLDAKMADRFRDRKCRLVKVKVEQEK